LNWELRAHGSVNYSLNDILRMFKEECKHWFCVVLNEIVTSYVDCIDSQGKTLYYKAKHGHARNKMTVVKALLLEGADPTLEVQEIK
jgi:hypothetical protein